MVRSVLAGVTLLSVLAGCSQPGVSAQDLKNTYPKVNEAELEQKLKAAGKWDEYQKGKAQDKAYQEGG